MYRYEGVVTVTTTAVIRARREKIAFRDVLYSLGNVYNFLSVSKIRSKGFRVAFDEEGNDSRGLCKIVDKSTE